MSPVGTYDASTVTRVPPSMRNQRTKVFPSTTGASGIVVPSGSPAVTVRVAYSPCSGMAYVMVYTSSASATEQQPSASSRASARARIFLVFIYRSSSPCYVSYP